MIQGENFPTKWRQALTKSDWTRHDMCFKANKSVSSIGHRSSQTPVSITNCLGRKCRNGRESRTRFNFSDRPDRVPQTAADAGDKLRRREGLYATVADHMETRLRAGWSALPRSQLMPIFLDKISVGVYEKAGWPSCRDPGLRCRDLGKPG